MGFSDTFHGENCNFQGHAEANSFYRYCATRWSEHVACIEEYDYEVLNLIERFAYTRLGNIRFYEAVQLNIHQESRPAASEQQGVIMYRESKDTEEHSSTTLFLHLMLKAPAWISLSLLKNEPELLHTDIVGYGTPLRIAVWQSRHDLVMKFIKLGADIHQRCHTRIPELKHSEMLSDTLSKLEPGEYIFQHKPVWRSIFHEVVLYSEDNRHGVRSEMFQYFLTNTVDINVRDSEGATALHCAALSNNSNYFEALVRSGMDIHAESTLGKTALHTAVYILS